jgi:hypothetical protein
MAIAGIRAKGKRGPKFNPRTQAIYKFCYDAYYANNKSRSEVMRLVNDKWPGAIMDERHVQTFAIRWAKRDKDNPLPIPQKTPKAGGGT